jgi:hypothetical protein
MVQMLIVGLVWLSLTAVLCLVIGRALRTGDVREEERVRANTAAVTPAELGAGSPGRLQEAGSFTPDLSHPVDDEEISRWEELWRWEDELRRGVDRWYGDDGPGAASSGEPEPPAPVGG